MRRAALSCAALLCTLSTAACSSQGPTGTLPDAGDALDAAGSPALPLSAPAGAWTWFDIEGSVCDDGTPTGIAVNPSPSAGPDADLLIYFVGGGACWDYLTCAVLNTSSHGPFGRTQFEQQKSALNGTILDRARPQNPVAGFHMVVVPYCTGDLHAGDNVATYQGSGSQRVIHHKGHANVLAFLPRVAATWPSPRKLIMTGSSAGGYGATLNYDLFRTRFAGAVSYLIDDSGPLFVGDAVPRTLRDTWYAQWNLQNTVAGSCPACSSDLSQAYTTIQNKYPSDRLSLLSYTQDQVIRAYLGNKSATQFQTDLYQLATTRFDPSSTSRVFFVTGDSHVLLTAGEITSQGTTLTTFLNQQLTNATTWNSVRP